LPAHWQSCGGDLAHSAAQHSITVREGDVGVALLFQLIEPMLDRGAHPSLNRGAPGALMVEPK
jgi:hypothetical protein